MRLRLHMEPDQAAPSYITCADGVRLAYHFTPGKGPTIVFLPGYMSDMQGSKALAVEAWAVSQGRAMLRLDYSGCGESDGAFVDGTLDLWRNDVMLVIAQVAPGPALLIGSSMGGWLMLLVALALGPRVKGLIGIAAAPDFTDWGFTDTEKTEMRSSGQVLRPSDYADSPMTTTLGFFNSGNANLLLGSEIALQCPVRLLHGQCDPDVPWETSLKLAERLRSADVQTVLVKSGDHRLSRDQDIALLLRTLDDLLEIL